MEHAIEAFEERSHGLPATLLPLGICLYLLGPACFHRTLDLAPVRDRAHRVGKPSGQ
jgi:hypothetical protein